MLWGGVGCLVWQYGYVRRGTDRYGECSAGWAACGSVAAWRRVACGVWRAVCDVRCAMCDVRCAVCGVRCAVCGVRCAVCGVAAVLACKTIVAAINGGQRPTRPTCPTSPTLLPSYRRLPNNPARLQTYFCAFFAGFSAGCFSAAGFTSGTPGRSFSGT